MSIDFNGLSEAGLEGYFAEFSTAGSIPSSLNGYGLGATQQPGYNPLSADYETADTGPKPRASDIQIGTKRYNELRAMLVKDVQWGLSRIGYKVPITARLDAATKTAYANYVKNYRPLVNGEEPSARDLPYTSPYAPDLFPAAGGVLSPDYLWANTYALADLGTRAKRAAAAPTATTASRPTSTATSTATGKTAGNAFTTSTASIQDILVRLGWRGKGTTTGPVQKVLTDETYDTATAENWKASASKRKLDTTITKASADGKQTTVNADTFYALKTVADQLVPPTKPVTPVTGGTTTVTLQRLGEVLGRLTGAKIDQSTNLGALYYDVASTRKLDPTISKNDQGAIVVSETSWKALVKEYEAKAPPPPPVRPDEKAAVQAASDQITKASTSSLPIWKVKTYFNIAIRNGVLKREAFSGDDWKSDYAPLLIAMRQITDPVAKKGWEQVLVPGKLVSKDAVKLPPDQASQISKAVDDYLAQQKAGQSRSGFSKVDSAAVIKNVNNISVSSKTFDVSGGAKTLADALKTFLDNTKQSVSGDLVWVNDKKEVFINDAVKQKLQAATDGYEKRKQAAQSYRAKMVDDALKVSTAIVSIDDMQLAFIETVESGKAGSNKTVYSAVRQNGSFDAPTKTAYTALARDKTIGPSVLEFEKLLKAQMGVNFKVAFVEETRNAVWNDFLAKAVSDRSVKTLPVIGKALQDAAKARRGRLGDAEIDRRRREEARKALLAAIAKSTVIVPVFDAQMCLLWGQKHRNWKIKNVKTTGVADAALGEELKRFSAAAFSIDPIPNDVWQQYLEATGIKVKGDSATFGWAGSNFIAVPASTATQISNGASNWIQMHGAPAGYEAATAVNPLNKDTRVRFTNATVIRAERPKQKTEPAKTEPAKTEPAKTEPAKTEPAKTEPAKTESKAAPKKKTKPKTSPTQTAKNTQERTDTGSASGGSAGGGSSAGGAGGASAGGEGGRGGDVDINIQMPPAPPPAPPEPTPTPTPEPPPAPPEPGGVSMGTLGILLAAGLGVFLLSKDDKKKQEQYPGQRRTQ